MVSSYALDPQALIAIQYKNEGPNTVALLFPPCLCVMWCVSLLTSALFTLGLLALRTCEDPSLLVCMCLCVSMEIIFPIRCVLVSDCPLCLFSCLSPVHADVITREKCKYHCNSLLNPVFSIYCRYKEPSSIWHLSFLPVFV